MLPFSCDGLAQMALDREAARTHAGQSIPRPRLTMEALTNEPTEAQEAEIEKFAAKECARMAQIEVKNAKRKKAKDKEDVVALVQEFVRKHDWPESGVAKDWLKYKADPTHKMGLSEGLSLLSQLLLLTASGSSVHTRMRLVFCIVTVVQQLLRR